MNATQTDILKVLIVGNRNLAYSIAVCLLKANVWVHLCPEDEADALNGMDTHFAEMKKEGIDIKGFRNRLQISSNYIDIYGCSLAIVITPEKVEAKREMISRLEKCLLAEATIAINTESISLDEIQEGADYPQRIVGLNWTEPAHTTCFLEIITNSMVKDGIPGELSTWARKSWNKDPYIAEDFGIRSKLMSAMVREALYLVENGFATIDDIDRACRNDPGYYLPFAGNCRYMDLMGTYAYGKVMKELNPDLSKEQRLPEFYTEIIKRGGKGMQNGEGFYHYSPEEQKFWKRIVSEFSYRIEEIISKYPFNDR